MRSPVDAQGLIHELQVHPIELEMENDDDLAPVGYVTATECGLIHESNLTVATLLGVRRMGGDEFAAVLINVAGIAACAKLLRQADHALYQAKRAGKNSCRIYDGVQGLNWQTPPPARKIRPECKPVKPDQIL